MCTLSGGAWRCSESAVGNISDINIISLEIVTPVMVFGVILKAFGIILVSSGTMGRLSYGSLLAPAGWLAGHRDPRGTSRILSREKIEG